MLRLEHFQNTPALLVCQDNLPEFFMRKKSGDFKLQTARDYAMMEPS